ncbi:MAG: enoyl-[acyl-carrier-protein] reductase FabI [Acidimicrobiia bacterium]
MLLKGKTLLITGVLTDDSIAFHVAKAAISHGANVYLTSFGRARSLTERSAKRLPLENPPEVFELDASDEEHPARIAKTLSERGKRLDGVLHAIGFAPQSCLGGGFLTAPWEDVSVALQVSAYSLASISRGLKPVLDPGSSIVALDFDASVAWPIYDWMGVAKAALESTARYLARDLGPQGIRVNLISAGPLRTMAAKGIPGFDRFGHLWERQAPLGWNEKDPSPVADACVFLFSDLSRGITGEIVHVDGGFHALGAPIEGI